jgi:hypothetical protein
VGVNVFKLQFYYLELQYRDKLPHLGNTTTNRAESKFGKFKEIVLPSDSVATLIVQIIKWQLMEENEFRRLISRSMLTTRINVG